MMADSQSPISSTFLQLYAPVDWGNDLDRAKRRWAGVTALIENPGNDEIETLIRLAFKTRQMPSAQRIQAVRQAFKEVDDMFEMQGNDRELQVLAAAALASVFEAESETASAAALAVTTSAAFVERGSDLTIDMKSEAERAVFELADGARRRPDLRNRLSKVPKVDFSPAVAKVKEKFDADGLAAAFPSAAESVTRVLTQFGKDVETALADASHFLSIQDEELQMLWWLTGQRSWDFDSFFADISSESRPLVLAKELAALTQALPGPRAAAALLARSEVSPQYRLSIPAAVNACDRVWLTGLVTDSDPSPVTQQIHFAIKRKLETGDANSWIPGWSATTEISDTATFSALEIGTTFYRERLLSIFPLE